MCCGYVVVFFFKQKTAYEMRISDWSSDVCSSDLEGTYFMVMEFVDGRSLSEILRSEGPLHPDRAADIGADIAAALGFAHRNGVVHRDEIGRASCRERVCRYV